MKRVLLSISLVICWHMDIHAALIKLRSKKNLMPSTPFHQVEAPKPKTIRPLILLNPAGDATRPGRRMVEGYERGLTLQFAEKLQSALADRFGIRPLLTRNAGEEVVDLQNASFANRLNADLYLSVHCHRSAEIKPTLSLYYLMYNQLIDDAAPLAQDYAFIPLNQAHYRKIKHARSLATQMSYTLRSEPHARLLDCRGAYGIPFKPLKGILAPGIGIELGLCREDQWASLIEPILDSLVSVIEELKEGLKADSA